MGGEIIMCLGIPGKVVKIENKTGTVELMGVSRAVSLELLENVQVGDYVIVHAGCAIEKIDEEEAVKTIKLFEEIEELANG